MKSNHNNRSHLMNKIKFIPLVFLTAITLMTGIAFAAEGFMTQADCESVKNNPMKFSQCMEYVGEINAAKRQQQDNRTTPPDWNNDVFSNMFKYCLDNPSACPNGGYIRQTPPPPPKCVPKKKYQKAHIFMCQGINMYGNTINKRILGKYSNCENGYLPGLFVFELEYPYWVFAASNCDVEE